MYTKTWKLGEVCRGGVITVEIRGKVISVIGKEWDFSAGSRKSSNQSNAKEFTRGTIASNENDAERKIMDFLEDLSTYYWAGEIFKWIKTKVTFENKFGW